MEFENKTTSIKGENGEKIKYLDLVNMGLNIIISSGMNSRTMAAIISFQKSASKIAKTKKIKLTLEEIELLKVSVQAMEGRWTVLSEEIIDFISYINSF